MSADDQPLSTVDVSADEPGTVVVRLTGELDLSSVAAIEAEVGPALAARPRRLIIDLSGVRFADSSAIALWVRWVLSIEQFELRDPPPFLRRVLATMGLSERLGVEA
jgi:anti-sigma B factor antagonist